MKQAAGTAEVQVAEVFNFGSVNFYEQKQPPRPAPASFMRPKVN